MKRALIAIFLLAAFSSSCFAFGMLTTGTTVGQEKWEVQAQYSTTGFTQFNTTGSFGGLGAKATYGLTKDLDIYAELWDGSYVVSDFDVSDAANSAGVGVKYGFLKTADNDPIDLAGFIDLASISSNHLTWGVNTVGVSASKMIRPQLTLYGVAAAMMNSWKVKGTKSISETDTDFGVGVKYDVKANLAVLAELDRFWVDTNQFQTISVAAQWSL
jgi:hypothetical protein